jgi:20S proteasome alpha/beta subunit
MKSNVDQAYLHFDESGSIPAIKNARITLAMGLPIIAVRDDAGVSVAAISKDNPLAEGGDKLVQVSKYCWALVTGHGGDSKQVRNMLRDLAVNHKFVLGSEISPKEVSLSLGDHLHELGMGHRRPLGAGIVIVGFDVHGRVPVIYHCDVDGNVLCRRAVALGREAGQAEHVMIEAIKAGEDTEIIVKKAADATIAAMKTGNSDFADAEFSVEIATYKA